MIVATDNNNNNNANRLLRTYSVPGTLQHILSTIRQKSYSYFTDDKTNTQRHYVAHPKTLLLHWMQTQEWTLKSMTIISILPKKLHL